MIGLWLRAWVRLCINLLVLLALVGVARVSFVAWSQRTPKIVYTPVSATASEAARGLPDISLGLDALRGKLVAPIPSDLLDQGSASAAGRASRPSRSRVFLTVNVIPDRSEVIINGVSYGHTPYVGEIGCQNGARLSITVLPPKGMPKTYERSCDRREIRIEE
jgi:hypothetical protein